MAVTSSKRVGRNSFTMRRTNDWVMSTDVPTDVTVDVCGTSFSLHKFPLVSRCGKLRKLVAEARDPELSRVEFPYVPGGSEAFELAAKFCYGINFDITASSVAMLRCVAEFLEMTDDYGKNNLVAKAEAFLEDVVVHSLGNAITVLHACEKLLPEAEDLNIVGRCVHAVGTRACQEQIALSKSSSFGKRSKSSSSQLEWWAEELSILNLDFYQRVLEVMRTQGMPQENLWGSLMHYAQKALTGMTKSPNDQPGTTAAMEHEQRMLVETIVRLLPSEKNSASSSFLFGLLRTAIVLDTTVSCRLDLERRISLQLEDASLDDMLIPSFSYTSDTLFDTEIVHRIVSGFFQLQLQPGKASQTGMTKVAKLLDSYLSEVAPDANLKLSKFVSLAELLPEEARTVHDGLYRAVDIYFKSHASLGDPERRRICKLLDAERLSQEACNHAAQNERLPAHFIIQVLYFEQLRLKTIIANFSPDVQNEPTSSRRMSVSAAGPAGISPRPVDQVALRRENRELKIELTKMKTRLSDLEKDGVFKQEETSSTSSTTSSGKFFQSFSRRLGRLNPFGKSSLSKPPATPDYQKPRNRRHSIS